MELGASTGSSSPDATAEGRFRRHYSGTSSSQQTQEPAAVFASSRLREAFSELEALQEEAALLEHRTAGLRANHPEEPQLLRSPIGVALSGGGVRAAAFHCGLLWALSSQGLMKDVLHLSSVSGGAYTAASLATHLLKDAEAAGRSRNLDDWYKEVVAQTILRMQHNINYLVRLGDGQTCFPNKEDPKKAGRGFCPRLLDIPMFFLTILSSIILSPTLILVNAVWPLVLCIEHSLGGVLRTAWCDPISHSWFSKELFHWMRVRLTVGTGGMLAAAVLLALLARLGCCKPRPPGCFWYLFRRSAQQVFARGSACYFMYILVPWVLLEMQNMAYGLGTLTPNEVNTHGSEWVRYHCWRYIDQTEAASVQACSDTMDTWYLRGNNALYLNASWVALHGISQPNGTDPGGATQYSTPLFLILNGYVLVGGLLGLLLGLSLLRWFLTLAGPIWVTFLVAQVAQWQIFGPLTGQALVASGILHYSPENYLAVFHLCTLGAILTLPVYDILLKLMHYYYRRSLQTAYFYNGRDVDVSELLHCPYCPNLLLGACVNDYRKPDEDQLLCDFTLSPLFLGCPRTGFFHTDSQARLGYLMSVSAAAPDTFMLTKFDVLPIRFLLSVLSLRLGDFVRLEADGQVAVQVGSAVRRFGETHHAFGSPHRVQQRGDAAQYWAQRILDRAVVACPFILCHLLLVVAEELDERGSCKLYNVLLQVGLAGFLTMLVLSFFAFAPQMRWLMRSPLILQFQMMFMHRHKAARPPPYLYVSDGGLIECLGVLMLLRRRLRLIICTDACEDMHLTLRALRDTMILARKERLCSFYDIDDPRRDVELLMGEMPESTSPYLRLGIRYEPSSADQGYAEGELLYIRMRLAPGDTAPERPLLEKPELLQTPPQPQGSAFNDEGMCQQPAPVSAPMSASLLTEHDSPEVSEGGRPRSQMDGICCDGWLRGLGRLGGRRFPDFGTGNQFLQPRHFANLCALGAEMALPAAKHAASVQLRAAA